jgi:type I restriction enzyme R subunit
MFTYNGFIVISDGLEAKAGSISSGYSHFMAWKSIGGTKDESRLVSQLETLIRGMLNKKTLLDIIHHFIVFEKSRKEDKETGIVSIQTVKKIAYYHQYFAVNKAVESTLRASGYAAVKDTCSVNEAPENYGIASVRAQPVGDHKGGVIWHTQGSGKSLSMVFFAGKIIQMLDNPTILVITDRNDLDDQLFDTFAASKQLLRQTPSRRQAENTYKNARTRLWRCGVYHDSEFPPEEGTYIPGYPIDGTTWRSSKAIEPSTVSGQRR